VAAEAFSAGRKNLCRNSTAIGSIAACAARAIDNGFMFDFVISFGRMIAATSRDIAPVVLVVAFFQLVVLRQPFPNLENVIAGLILVMIGLALFMRGLDMALFPIGEALAGSFARKGSLAWLLAFAFALGFGTTVAEPALIAICTEAAKAMAAAGAIADEAAARASYALKLRYTVALSVGVALLLGVFRIVKGWPVHWMIMAGYILVVGLTAVAPKEIVGIAYDLGGVTTSTITVPLVTALGVGLASAIRGRNAMTDGFGLIAFASLSPMIFVLIFGML